MTIADVKPDISFCKTSVVAMVQNPTMKAIGKLKYTVNIRDKKTDESVQTVTYSGGMELEPVSIYRFTIDWQQRD